MRITALAGGVGGARFLRGLRAHLDRTPDLADSTVTVIGNTGDDITLFGLRVCPDLDTVLYTLGGGVNEEQGWGRADETHAVQQELAAYGAVRSGSASATATSAPTSSAASGSARACPLSRGDRAPGRAVGAARPARDAAADDRHPGRDPRRRRRGRRAGPQAVHFQEWWVRMRAAVPAQRFVAVGMDRATAAPGVLDAIRERRRHPAATEQPGRLDRDHPRRARGPRRPARQPRLPSSGCRR